MGYFMLKSVENHIFPAICLTVKRFFDIIIGLTDMYAYVKDKPVPDFTKKILPTVRRYYKVFTIRNNRLTNSEAADIIYII